MSARRRTGILVPLFSLVSSRSWGTGEFLDLPVFVKWAASAGQAFVQILPVSELPENETSPYSAMTAMAIDPMYITMAAVDDFQALGGEGAFADDDKRALAEVREAPRVRHGRIGELKRKWLRKAHEHFEREHLARKTDRAAQFAEFARAESWWLDDYALFQALRRGHRLRAWWDWPEALRKRDQAALANARSHYAAEISYRKYAQWVAWQQWEGARSESAPTEIFGDLPFMISGDSPDVWTRQNEFRLDATVGVPPDAFSKTGQDWGLPPWRHEVMAANDFTWMRQRARRNAALYHGFRLDHLVGLYRTYIRPKDKKQPNHFAPDKPAEQLALGERLVRIYQETGAELIAEDLGTVPDPVRASLARLKVPGFKVLRWERSKLRTGKPYIDPHDYPEVSVATSGTHDIEPLAAWWDTLSTAERTKVLAIPSLAKKISPELKKRALASKGEFEPELLDALVRLMLDSNSSIVILPLQDVFGWRDRINTPATQGDENWNWKLPWLVDEFDEHPQARERAKQLKEWSAAARRTTG